MKCISIPANYHPILDEYDTQRAIAFIKTTFEREFSNALNLKRVSAPLFVTEESGLNDNLNGFERPVSFDVPAIGKDAQVVHSLAKWKRFALKRYHFSVGNGLYTDMNAIRRDEELDNIHSIYVDQWDWEKIITQEERNLDYLKKTVQTIYNVIKLLSYKVANRYPELATELPSEIFFISTKELEKQFPTLSRKEREDEITKQHKAVFIYQIGWNLEDGKPHDGRAADYDDWLLNGDIILWYDVLGHAFELSSMGIRVSPESLRAQLEERKMMKRAELDFHKKLLAGELTQTLGGGIGQSRLCMFLLRKAHIGETQVSVWTDEIKEDCKKRGIILL